MSRLSIILIAAIGILTIFTLAPALVGQRTPSPHAEDIPAAARPVSESQFETIELKFARAQEIHPVVWELCYWRTIMRSGSTSSTMKIIADPRTNSLLVRADASDMERIKKVVALVDRQAKGEKKIQRAKPVLNVMSVKNRNASLLGGVVQQILEAETGRKSRIDVVVDAELNALITFASDQDNERVRKIVAVLDQKPAARK